MSGNVPATGPGERMPRADVAALTRRLTAIDATNPSLVPGGAGERELAGVIAEWLADRGLEVRLVGADPARPSVLARRRGTGAGRTLLLAGHLDTVGGSGAGDGVSDPDPDRVLGRGAYDMAGGLAAAMTAAAAASDPAGDVVLAFAADEEFGSVGMEELLAAIDADAAASADPCPRPDDPMCQAAVQHLRAESPHGIVVAAPLTRAAVDPPLGWTLSADSRERLDLALADQAGACAGPRVQGYACLSALLRLLRAEG